MTDYVRALVGLVENPNISYTGLNPDYDDIIWNDNRPKPTKEECDNAYPQFAYEDEYFRVKNARRNRYVEETDGMFFDAMRSNGDLVSWSLAVDAIKSELPYPTIP